MRRTRKATRRASLLDRFSQEIIDEIIDCIVPQDSSYDLFMDNNREWGLAFNTLKACALVCKAFLRRSRHHLFAKIQFWPGRLETDIKNYTSLLISEPYISNDIRNLHLNIISSETQWITEGTAFTSIMHRFQQSAVNLTGLLIVGHSEWCKWDNPRALETKFITPFIHSQHITYIHLWSQYNIPLSLLSGCAHLSRVFLAHTAPEPYNVEAKKIILAPLPKITQLDFNMSGKMIAALCGSQGARPFQKPLLDFSQVRILCLRTIVEEDVQVIRDHLMDICAASVQELRWEVHELFAPYPEYKPLSSEDVDIHRFVNLRVFNIDIECVIKEKNKDPVAHLCDYLSAIPSTNILTTLGIRMLIRPDLCAKPLAPYHYSDADWAQLDAEIIRISDARAFKVDVRVEYESSTVKVSELKLQTAICEEFVRVHGCSSIDFKLKFQKNSD